MKPVQVEKWLTRKQAAEKLGVGERRILTLAKEGAIRSKRERDPVSHQMSIAVEDQSLREYIDKQASGPERTDSRESRALQTIPATNGGALMRDLPAPWQLTAVKDPLWLPLDRAAVSLGLPAAYIRRLIERGELPARNILEGTDAKGVLWRVHKQDLENLRGKKAAHG